MYQINCVYYHDSVNGLWHSTAYSFASTRVIEMEIILKAVPESSDVPR